MAGRFTQVVVEAILQDTDGAQQHTQVVVEAILAPQGEPRVTQLVPIAGTSENPSETRVSHLQASALEAGEFSEMHITHLYTRANVSDTPSRARVTHLYVQVLAKGCIPRPARIITSPLNDITLRPQYMGHKVITEVTMDPLTVSEDDATWTVQEIGYCTRATLQDALTWEFIIGDTDRIERNVKLFSGADLLIGEPSAFFGVGPGFNPFLPVEISGMNIFRVRLVETGEFIVLGWVEGPGFFNSDNFNDIATEFAVESSDYLTFNRTTIFPDIVVELHDPVTGELITTGAGSILGILGQFTPISGGLEAASVIASPSYLLARAPLFGISISVAIDWAENQPAIDARYAVYMYVARATEQTPFHLAGHPVDIETQIYDALGIVYDPASATETKDLIGPQLAIFLRPTDEEMALDVLENWLQGPAGFAYRIMEGVRQFYPTRYRDSAIPGTTLTLAALRGEGTPYMLSDQRVITKVVWEELTFFAFIDDGTIPLSERPLDGIISRPLKTTFNQDDGNASPYGGEQVYQLPGFFLEPIQLFGPPPTGIRQRVAEEIFFRWGRGGAEVTLPLLPGWEPLIGQFVLNTLNYSPIPEAGQDPLTIRPKDYPEREPRQVFQITKRSDGPAGPECVFQVVGPVAADLPTTTTLETPTITIEPIANKPHNAAFVTVTNWTSIHADPDNRVEMQYGTGTVQPITWTSAGSLYGGTAGVIGTPELPAGSHIWARARTWTTTGAFSAWSDVVDVQLSLLDPPSNLVGTQVDNTLTFVFTWINGANGDPGEPTVLRIKQPLDIEWTEIIMMAPGSTRFEYTFELPNVSYEVEVFHRQNLPIPSESAHISITVTTGTTLPQLNPPINPKVSTDGAGHVTMCIDVGDVNADQTVFQIAAENAGGGFDAMTTYAIQAHAGNPICATATVPQSFSIYDPDRNRFYQLQAYHTALGYIDSDFTEVFRVDPWEISVQLATEQIYNYAGDPLPNYNGQTLEGIP